MPNEGAGNAASHGQGAFGGVSSAASLPGALDARRLGRLHHGADLQPILPGDHDPLTGRQALLDDRLAVTALADLDGLDPTLLSSPTTNA